MPGTELGYRETILAYSFTALQSFGPGQQQEEIPKRHPGFEGRFIYVNGH